MRRLIQLAWFSLSLCLSLPVFAVDGYVSTDVNLRSGPGTDYPPVAVVPRWNGLQVYGCIGGYSWCDVQFGPDRGWVYAEYLSILQNGEPVYLSDYGPRLGIPVVTFVIGNYWDSYYRTRPWYRQRSYWVSRPPPVFRPLPPRPPGMRPQRPPGGRPFAPGPRPPVARPPGRPPVAAPPARPPAGNGPGNRPPQPNPGNNRPGGPNNGRPPAERPENRPPPNPGNRPRPEAPRDSAPARPQTRPAPQDKEKQGG